MAKYLIHSPGLASRRIGDEEVIVSPRAGKVWSLNQAGALIWELADGSVERDELAATLAECRGVEPEAAGRELDGFAETMTQLGLATWRQVPGVRGNRSRRAAERPPRELAEAPKMLHEEPLQVLAGACDSSHSGQGAACMLVGSCTSGFN
jgi:hypothetical protein